jgi:hypothetical protein
VCPHPGETLRAPSGSSPEHNALPRVRGEAALASRLSGPAQRSLRPPTRRVVQRRNQGADSPCHTLRGAGRSTPNGILGNPCAGWRGGPGLRPGCTYCDGQDQRTHLHESAVGSRTGRTGAGPRAVRDRPRGHPQHDRGTKGRADIRGTWRTPQGPRRCTCARPGRGRAARRPRVVSGSCRGAPPVGACPLGSRRR